MDNQQLKLNNQICFPIYTVSRLITKAYKPFLEEMGLTYPQYLVLLVLWENDELSMNQIGKKLLLNTNTLSPLIKRMEKMDLLFRNRSKEDERSVFIHLTEKGKELKNNAIPIPEKLLNTLLTEDVSLTEVMLLKDTLNKWIDILSEQQNAK
ncbi:DNA-binding transcriptional regulator, MarR family [Salegentibacter holothuriorum]|uniref:HTH-type transcriptional regulator SarZ n=1 Tax=Salegentibacter holothuriorum TaxID=241145 RepID=A0A1T5A5I0_9FLAO|nr:MarR family transcriptional regulator [Salegentibacter holothuriorum]SKB29997.1 DNA-binding transcriptional regulator, MarR family [Salegentibacter holothuriorum]